MTKLNIQKSRLLCSNLHAIIVDMVGNHLKDCKNKSDVDSYILTNKGTYFIIYWEGIQKFTSNTILNNASLN